MTYLEKFFSGNKAQERDFILTFCITDFCKADTPCQKMTCEECWNQTYLGEEVRRRDLARDEADGEGVSDPG